MVLLADKTCLSGITVESFAATATAVAILMPASASVNVPALPDVFVTTISVTTVVVDAGTVYKVVAVLVVAAPLKSALVVVAINYYLLLLVCSHDLHELNIFPLNC